MRIGFKKELAVDLQLILISQALGTSREIAKESRPSIAA